MTPNALGTGRLAAASHQALRWCMLGRDPDGHLVTAATLPCGPQSDLERHCTMALTPTGLVYRTTRAPLKRALLE